MTPPSLAALPPEVLRGLLLYLPSSSRAALRQCGNDSLRRVVESFERDILLGDGACTNGGGGDKDAFEAVRRELVHEVQDKMWLSRTRDEKGDVVPGRSHLRRVTAGEMLSKPDFMKWPTVRQHSYYSDAKIVDDRYWVLYSDYWYSFEVFDLETGKSVDFGCPGLPDKNYLCDEERMSMLMEAFDGRHGMLAVGMALSGSVNPHGAWSGPYLTVCGILEDRPRMVAVDLYRPLMHIDEVNVVSKEKVAVLLTGADGVELQWHAVPPREKWHQGGGKVPVPTPGPPGAAPPPHQCSRECPIFGNCLKKKRLEAWRGTKEFWEEQQRMKGRKEGEETEPSYDARVKYEWWPAQTTMLQSKIIRHRGLEGHNNATMASDGKGMLVVVVGSEVQVWHVGSMSLLRGCHPYDSTTTLRHHERISARSLSMHTALYPVDDVLGPGEGSYYTPDRQKDIPQLQSSRLTQGSTNPIDLASCDELALLSRCSHLTYDDQRNFEREHRLKEGSCSPQLDCIVRVAFAVFNEEDELRNRIMTLDINPFHYIRHRESLELYDEEDYVEINLQQYRDACEGKGLKASYITNYSRGSVSGEEQIMVLDWSRGGIFDFPGGPCCEERELRLHSMMNRLMGGNYDDDHPEVTKLCRAYADTQKQILRQRYISGLSIDASKLVICTGSEIAVVPFALARSEVYEEWEEIWNRDHSVYECSVNHGAWHSFRPLDGKLLSNWNDIMQRYGEAQPTSFGTITADLRKCHLKEQSVMESMRYNMPHMKCPCISGRYLAVLCDSDNDPFSGDGDSYERLHVFDALAEWGIGGPRKKDDYSATPGVQLSEEEGSGD